MITAALAAGAVVPTKEGGVRLKAGDSFMTEAEGVRTSRIARVPYTGMNRQQRRAMEREKKNG